MRPTHFIAAIVVFAWVVSFASAQTKRAATTVPTTAESIARIGFVPPSDAPLPPGMTRLFDGKSLDGWKQRPADSWVARNSVLASLGAARGLIYTDRDYGRYRVVFDVRHVSGKPDHRAGVLIFCNADAAEEKPGRPSTTLEGVQFQVPNGGHWDYRLGKNNSGKEFFTRIVKPAFDEHAWSRVELLVDPKSGVARMAVAQPPGAKAVEVLTFKDPTAGRSGPFALQMHNKGLFDEFVNIAIEVDPAGDELVTTR